MSDSMAYAEGEATPRDLPGWKNWGGALAGILLAITFLVAGIWKITGPVSAAVRMHQALVPQGLSLPAAIGFGIAETFAGVLLIVPRFRRWGAMAAGVLLMAFMVYIGAFYTRLSGSECNCFPWIKRAVGPGFFLGDAVMLALAFVAGWWAKPSQGRRTAAVMLGVVTVFAMVSLGVTVAREYGVRAPETILVNGNLFQLHNGRIFIYFFNPECPHCDRAARELSRLQWGETRIVAVATQLPQFGPEFLQSTGLQGVLTPDVEKLRSKFSFVDVPYGVAIENGHQRAAFTSFEGTDYAATLKKLGFVN